MLFHGLVVGGGEGYRTIDTSKQCRNKFLCRILLVGRRLRMIVLAFLGFPGVGAARLFLGVERFQVPQ